MISIWELTGRLKRNDTKQATSSWCVGGCDFPDQYFGLQETSTLWGAFLWPPSLRYWQYGTIEVCIKNAPWFLSAFSAGAVHNSERLPEGPSLNLVTRIVLDMRKKSKALIFWHFFQYISSREFRSFARFRTVTWVKTPNLDIRKHYCSGCRVASNKRQFLRALHWKLFSALSFPLQKRAEA